MTATAPNPVAPDHGRTPGTARAALSYRSFRIVFTGLALSQVGTWMQNFTLPAYIDDRTGRPALVGLMIFMQLGPLLVLSIPAGVLADKVSKQKLMLVMQSVSRVVHDPARLPGRQRRRALDDLRDPTRHRRRQRAQRARVPVVDAAARAPSGPPGRDQPQLGDDQRQPRDGPGARRAARRARHVDRADLPRQRRHLPLLHRALLVVHMPDVRGSFAEKGWRACSPASTSSRTARC